MVSDKKLILSEKAINETEVSVDALKSSLKSESVSQSDHQESKTVSAKTEAKEIGGRGGLDPTRYGDWEKNGRCIDF